MNDAKTQEILNKQAREEEDKRQKAEANARRQQELIDSQKKANQEYENAVENIERHESDHNYEEMLEWAEIALTNRPDDEFAKEKAALARQLHAEQKAVNKQFNTVLLRAKTAFSEERWTDAVSQCDMALELKPDSDEVSRLKNEARRRMEIKEKVQTFLNRADVFFAQKLYAEALKEVNKILALDSFNHDAKEIERKISEVHAQHEEIINTLVTKLNEAEQAKDYVSAISICESLIEEDSANIRKWTSQKERLNSQQKEIEENKRKLDELKKNINKAHFDEDWIRLKLLCETYLKEESDQDVTLFLTKAKKRLEETKVKEAKEKALATINGLIIDGHINEAKKELDRFAQNYPSEHSVVKDLRKKLFSFDSEIISQRISNPPRKPIGFGASNISGTKEENDFFEIGTKEIHPQKKNITKREPTKKYPKKDDFFDSSSTSNPEKSSIEPQITNNDFNF